jgi:CheY-like chemotaxis protein
MSEAMPRLLLVDDEERLLKTLRKRWEEKGFPVQVAGSGAEALKIIKAAFRLARGSRLSPETIGY